MHRSNRREPVKGTGGIVEAAKKRLWRGVKVGGLYALWRSLGATLAVIAVGWCALFALKHLYYTPASTLFIFAPLVNNLKISIHQFLSAYPYLWPVWDMTPLLDPENPLKLFTDGGWALIPITWISAQLLHRQVKEPHPPSSSTTVNGTMNVGMMNYGPVAIEHIDSIAGCVNRMSSPDEARVLDAIKAVTKAVTKAPIRNESQRTEMLELLVELARHTALPAAERRLSVTHAIVRGLDTAVNIAGNLASVWSTWGKVIKDFFEFRD
jgi:hypothetical protein